LARSILQQLQSALGASYTIERELGRGGMATVYLARDTKHQRPVALKVLEPDLAASLGSERFRREITTAAQLQHPHILGVFDSGETADGQLWFTMPFVEGESLRDQLKRERQLPIAEAVRITREIAGALDYAHEANVIHRDIKPENILLTKRGDALLADFGIARALFDEPSTGASPSAGLTMTGLAIGTPQYMSPEQASGDRSLDARSDVYALGAVCYEMLAGEPPFSGQSQQAIIAKMMTSDAPSVRVLRPGVSPEMDQVIHRALARVPGDRWNSAGEFASSLLVAERATQSLAAPSTVTSAAPRKRMPIAAVSLTAGFLIGAGLLFAWSSRGRTASASSSGAVRLAVLPFENLGESADAYFADGMTEAVHDKLTSLPGLEVIGSASARQYRGTTKSPQEIGRELGVRYLVEGRVRWDKGSPGVSRVRVSPELIDVQSAADKWAQPFDAPLTDVFQVQGDIAAKVAQSLQVALTPAAQQTLASRPTTDLLAYDAYLRARALAQSGSSPVALRRTIAAYREAVARDSNFALALSGLSWSYTLLSFNGVALPEFADSANNASARALALDPNLPEAHAARAAYYSDLLNDHARSLQEAKAGLAHTQNAELLAAAAQAEGSLGHWEEAAADAQQGVRLDPRSTNAIRRAARIALWRRDVAAARSLFDRACALAPDNPQLLEERAMAELQLGDLAAAKRRIRGAPASMAQSTIVAYLSQYFDLGWILDRTQEQLLLSLGPDAFDTDTASWAIVLAQQYHFRGDREKARAYAARALAALDEQLKASPKDDQRLVFRGLALAYMGRSAEAIRSGERGVALRSSSLDAQFGPYNEHQLARIYILANQPERALDILEKLLSHPYYLTPAWLRIDPNFAPLRGNPRFEKLVAGAKPVA